MFLKDSNVNVDLDKCLQFLSCNDLFTLANRMGSAKLGPPVHKMVRHSSIADSVGNHTPEHHLS